MFIPCVPLFNLIVALDERAGAETHLEPKLIWSPTFDNRVGIDNSRSLEVLIRFVLQLLIDVQSRKRERT